MENNEYEQVMAEAAERIEAVRGLGNQMAEVRGEGESAEGRVRVTTMPGGTLDTLEIDPRAMRMPSEDLAASIMEAAKKAADDGLKKSGELMESVLPGAGASIMNLSDPEKVADEKQESDETINAIVESLRSGFKHS